MKGLLVRGLGYWLRHRGLGQHRNVVHTAEIAAIVLR